MTLARVRGLKVCRDWHVVHFDAWVCKKPSRNPGCQWRGSIIDPLLLKSSSDNSFSLLSWQELLSMTGMVIHSQGAKLLNFWLIYRVKSCRYLHVSYLCISYLASLGHMSKLFYSCFQRYATAPPTYSQTSSKSHFYIWNEDIYSYMIPWLWNCLNCPLNLHSWSPVVRGDRKI